MKRLFCLLLCLVLVFSVRVSAWAAEIDTSDFVIEEGDFVSEDDPPEAADGLFVRTERPDPKSLVPADGSVLRVEGELRPVKQDIIVLSPIRDDETYWPEPSWSYVEFENGAAGLYYEVLEDGSAVIRYYEYHVSFEIEEGSDAYDEAFTDSSSYISGGEKITEYYVTYPWALAIPTEIDGHPVTGIGDLAFYWGRSLTSVTIPDSVTYIGDNPFCGCENLKSIVLSPDHPTLAVNDGVLFSKTDKRLVTYPMRKTDAAYAVPNGILTVGESAFSGCDYLQRVTVPESVTAIEPRAFQGCAALSSVSISGPVTEIGDEAFSGCKALEEVLLSSGVSRIGDHAFEKCTALSRITLPDSLAAIGEYAFSHCEALTDIALPDGLTAIGGYAFGQTGLRNIALPATLNEIGEYAFVACMDLTGISLPYGLTKIEDGLFFRCHGLMNISIPASVTSIGCKAFFNCDSLTGLTLPGSVTEIGENAFLGCDRLTGITISDENASADAVLTYRKENGETALGNPFVDCTALQTVAVSSDHPALASIDGVLFAKADRRLITYPHARESAAYTVPQGIRCIGEAAFYDCASLVSVVLPDSVTAIENKAFGGCTALTNITLPGSLPRIGDSAFENCAALTGVILPGALTELGEKAFSRCESLKSVSIPGGVKEIKKDAFDECSDLSSVTLQAGIEIIGEGAFNFCTNLTDLTVPGSVKTIGERAFMGCYSLRSLTLQEGLTAIESSAFDICTSLLSVSLPDTVTRIGDYAFGYCVALESIRIPDGLAEIGAEAFVQCNLTGVTLPGSVISIGEDAFRDNPLLVVTVEAGSYAERYCQDSGLAFVYAQSALDWLND